MSEYMVNEVRQGTGETPGHNFLGLKDGPVMKRMIASVRLPLVSHCSLYWLPFVFDTQWCWDHPLLEICLPPSVLTLLFPGTHLYFL